MEKKYHFITGLPRSGSTLLSSLLKQNPRFHASITDPLATMVKGVIDSSNMGAGIRTEVPVTRRENIIKSLFDGYYKDVDKEVIFNTNRAWTILTPQIDHLFPNSKFVVCVRDINWVLDSFETAHRKNPLSTNTVTGDFGGTVYTRMDTLMETGGVVGFAYAGIKQAITGNEKHKLMIIEYNQLCSSPESTIKALYNFIDQPQFEHDFNNVEASWDEYDAEIGIPLHKIRKKVEYIQRNTILPPDILNKYANMEVWRI
jgi:sulfotransferase